MGTYGRLRRWKGYLRLTGPGWLQSAFTLGSGSAVASLANLVPINLVANLGTLEAGWTAAFVALGVPLADAAATGLATHLWALVLHAVFGLLGWVVLGRSPRRRDENGNLPVA